jgi:outer membrane protein assembly factor BamA
MHNLYRLLLLTIIFTSGTVITCFCQLTDTVVQQDTMHHRAASDTSSVADTSNRSVIIANVNITGFKKTKLYIIEREIPFKEGDVISRSDLPAKLVLCKQQLMNTSLFVDVIVTIEREQSDLVFVNVLIKERWYLFPLPYFKVVDRNFNEWLVQNKGNLQRVNYGLKFMQNNVSGRNDKLNIWLISGYTRQASLRYENPFIDKYLKHGINIGLSYSRTHEINYATDFNKQKFLKVPDEFLITSFSVDLGYSYRPAIKTRHNFRVSYSDLSVKDTVLLSNPNFFPAGLRHVRLPDVGYQIEYYNVDYIPYPLKGFYGEARLYKRFGLHTGVWETGGKASYSFKMFPKTYMEFQAAGLLRLPFHQSYFSTRMFGSTDLYMRGLEYYVIEGVAGGMVRATAKREVASFSIPTFIKSKSHDKIPFRIFLKGFGDAGYAYSPNPGTSFLNNRLLRTGGVGIDILTFYDVVLKLEYSFNQFGEKGLFVHSKSDF